MLKINNGIYLVNNWYIIKINSKWYLLSNKEYLKNKDNLKDFIKNYFIDGFTSKKQLIEKYKNEVFYKNIF